MAVRSPQDVYARHISSSRGYPIWTPEPSSQLLSQRPEGLRIGDVGVVVSDVGSFDVFFNVCLPKSHSSTGVPAGFNPIELKDADIKTIRGAESVGQVLTPSSVTRVGSDEASLPPKTAQSGVTSYSFNLSSNEGAILVLPDGADSHDVGDLGPFFELASQHATTWYRFAEENLGRTIRHDALYVITGFHKARSCGLAGYHGNKEDGDFSAQLTVGVREDLKSVASCRWKATRNMDGHVGPKDSLGIPNQSVIIRGFKIALRNPVQGDIPRGISEQPDISSEDTDRTEGHNVAEGMEVQVEIRRMPEILPVFHPSDVINQYILRKEPSARVAITHDSDWGSILNKGLLGPEELAQDELLTKAVSEEYTIVLREDVAHLKSKRGADTSTTDDHSVAEMARHTASEVHEPVGVNGSNKDVLHGHPESLSLVSESQYRCVDETVSESTTSGSCPVGLHSIPSKFGPTSGPNAPRLPEVHRPIKIIVISDFICSFCYLCEKVLHDAIEACQDLPFRFDVEFRPFILLSPSSLPMCRRPYLLKRFEKEQVDITLKAINELAQKAGFKLTEEMIVCATAQAHRLSTKAYLDGGQSLQNKLNAYIFDACLAKGANISDEDFLIDAAVHVGLMNKEEAAAFLRSRECLDCVEKMVEAARAQGITGVPFIIIDGKWAINGLQPVECFIQIFRKLAHLPAPLTATEKLKTEHEPTVH